MLKRIGITASDDWSLLHTCEAFLRYLDPVVRFRGVDYKIAMMNLMAEPIRCGQSLRGEADVILDRASKVDPYYRNRCQQAACARVPTVNNPYTYLTYNKHATYHLLALGMHPEDRFPKTVLLPTFGPLLDEHYAEERWRREQEAILDHTRFGWDPGRRTTDWDAVAKQMRLIDVYVARARTVRERWYPAGDTLRRTMAEVFEDRYPVYLKRVDGGGGRGVYRIDSLEALYAAYDRSSGYAVHLQEGVERYDVFARCLAVGPQLAELRFEPDAPLHQRYSPERPQLDGAVSARLQNYVKFIGAYHRWTLNSFEAPVKDGRLYPIDFANGMPDLELTSLHVHFPLVIVNLIRWLSYCAVTGRDLRLDLEQEAVLGVLEDPDVTALEKYAYCAAFAERYFQTGDFDAFCAQNFPRIEEQMVDFYDTGFRPFIAHAVQLSYIPEHEHGAFVDYYEDLMRRYFRRDPATYLTNARPPGAPTRA
jgi:hypothetical protein